MNASFDSIESITCALRSASYIPTEAIATTVYLAEKLGKPILCEGPAGVGKTELAKSIARATNRSLYRLQCYEGLDESKTLYEWKYAKQLLYAQMLRDHLEAITSGAANIREATDRIAAHEDVFFSERFLQSRPILASIRSDEPSVLLIDEVDRAEDELEAFFLETLAEFQVTIPELGTLRAAHRPLVVLTSNASRELSDALRRRCLYLPIDFPEHETEIAIIRSHIPEVDQRLANRVASFVSGLRELDLKKKPSIAETLDWARSLVVLGATDLDAAVVEQTLSTLLKFRGDLETAGESIEDLLS